MNDRTCIVTRKSGSSEEMIRFVAGPDKHIVPDLKAVLPGRGAWVLASRPVIEEAIKRKAFARSLKADVIVEDKLVDLVDRLLVKAALGNLAMARKAGAVIFGSTKVESAIRSHQVRLVLHAKEAAYDGVRKIDQAIHSAKTSSGKDVSVLSLFGDNHVIHAALLNVQAAEGFIKTAHKLVAYRGGKRNEPEETTVEAVKETE